MDINSKSISLKRSRLLAPRKANGAGGAGPAIFITNLIEAFDLFFKINLFIFYLFFGWVSSLLHVGFSLVAVSGGYSVVVCGLLIAVASLVSEQGL